MLNNKQYLQELKQTNLKELFGIGEYNKEYPDIRDHLPRSMWKKLPPDLIKFIVEILSLKKPSEIADQHTAKSSSGFFSQDYSIISDGFLEAIERGDKYAKRFYDVIVKNTGV
jgi:hypothetical protein